MLPPPAPNVSHRDTQAPSFGVVTPSVSEIRPANGRFVPVSIDAPLVDLLDAAPSARIVDVTSNDPDPNPRRAPVRAMGPLGIQLRADRNTDGSERVYTIEVEGRDAAGNVTRRSVEVRVP